MTAAEYTNSRLNLQKNYYSKKSKWNKHLFLSLSLIQIILTAVIPVLATLGETIPHQKAVIASVAATSTVVASLILLLRPQEYWISYRDTLEKLKAEEIYFQANISPYDNYDEESRVTLYIQQCEKIMGAEHSVWKDTTNQSTAQT